MALTRMEREAINDSVLKIQSIESSLSHVDDSKVSVLGEIQECLRNAHQQLRGVLRESR
jgi:hypothetical protein